MRINWRVVGTADNHAVVEYSTPELPGETSTLNVRVQAGDNIEQVFGRAAPAHVFRLKMEPVLDLTHLMFISGEVEVSEPTPDLKSVAAPVVIGAVAGAFTYRFKAGDVLPEHAHTLETLHDIRVIKGRVLVKKESGDVEATPGTTITLMVGELHSVEALEPAETLHTRVNLT